MPVRTHQEQQVVPGERGVVRGGRRAVGSLNGDARAAGVPVGDRPPGQVLAEQDFTAGVGSDHPVTGPLRRETVYPPVDAGREQDRGQGVEVVFVRQQQHGRDPLQSRAAASGGGQQLAGGQLQAGLADLLALAIQGGPHQHLQAGGPQGQPEVNDPRVAADQERPGAVGPADAQPPGHGRRGQAVQGHRRHDHEEGRGQDLGRAADSLGRQARPERRGGSSGDNPARGHPADERALAFREIRFQRGREGRDGPGRDDQDRDEDERGQNQVPERLRGNGSRNGNEQHANNELHEGLEEWAAGRHVKAPHIGQREAHEDRRDEPGIVTESVAPGSYPDHRGELRVGAEHLAQPELAQQQPEQSGAGHAAGQPDRDAQQELRELAARAFAGARGDSVKHQRPEYSADRVDQ